MKLYHATPRKNLASIQRRGLLTGKSQGRLAAVWLHTSSKSSWAALHTVKRHGGRIEDVVIVEVSVPRQKLRRCHRRGLLYTLADISPARLGQLIQFEQLATSPITA